MTRRFLLPFATGRKIKIRTTFIQLNQIKTLSDRAQALSNNSSPLLHYKMIVQSNQYDKEHNPTGICNLGVAENHLCQSEIVEKLQSTQTWLSQYNFYPNSCGELAVRQTLCSFFSEILCSSSITLDPCRMIISSGVSGAISLLSLVIADAGDVFLIGSPYYTAFDFDVGAMANISLLKCPMLEQNTGTFGFAVEIFQKGYEEALTRKLKPRAIILVNPHNPLGDVYDEAAIQSVLKFAAEKKLHVIIDEIYAFSVFNRKKSFNSILKYLSLPDPSRTHFLWSFSKDFALSGTRIGVLYTGSTEACTIGAKYNFLMVPSSAIQYTLKSILEDRHWTLGYLKLNQSRLSEKYQKVKKQIEQIGDNIKVRNAEAGFFLWINFRSILHHVTFDEESKLFEIFFYHGVYITNGLVFGCSEPGWFRLIFTLNDEWINEGIERMRKALYTYQMLSVPVISS